MRLTERPNEFIFFRGSDLGAVPKKGGGTKNAAFDLVVTVGAGLPVNKAATYQMLSDLYGKGLVTAEEVRGFLSDYLGLPLDMGAATRPAKGTGMPKIDSMEAEGLTENGHVKKSAL